MQPEVATPPEVTQRKDFRFFTPTEEEVKHIVLEKLVITLDAQRFVDFYECKGLDGWKK